jgi:tetratricopeptide (TPR) repeat protein
MANLEALSGDLNFIRFVCSLPDVEKEAVLSAIGDTLLQSWEQDHSVHDIDGAIAMYEEAMACSSTDSMSLLNNFANALQQRFELSGSIDDLNRAIQITEQHITGMPEHYPHLDGVLNNLVVALRRRFERIQSIDDLNRAIDLNEKVIELTPEDHPHHTGRLNNLASNAKYPATPLRGHRTYISVCDSCQCRGFGSFGDFYLGPPKLHRSL